MKKKIFYIIFCILILPCFIVNLTLIIKSKANPSKIPDFMGYKPFIVLSGSMETAINIGDLIIVKDVNPKNIKPNDIITFKKDNVVISHRVVEIQNNEGTSIRFKTKGDNNNVADDFTVNINEIEGIFVNKIPGVGNFLLLLSKPMGLVLVILIIIILFTSLYFIHFNREKNG